MELEVRHLRYFVTLAEEASFTRAARRLGLAQSALSSQIQRMERHLGVPLIRRGGRQPELTAAGEELADQARRILASVRAAEVAVRAQAVRQPLRLGCLRAPWWPHELSRMVDDQLPAVRTTTETVDVLTGLRQVREGVLDVCLASEFDGFPVAVPDRLATSDVLHEPIWVALPDTHPAAAAGRVDLADLATDDWLLQPRGSYLRRAVEGLCQDVGFTPKPIVSGDSWELHGLIERGQGVTLCTPLTVPHDHFVTRPMEPVRWRRMFVAWLPDRLPADTVRIVSRAVGRLYRQHMDRVAAYAESPDDHPVFADDEQS